MWWFNSSCAELTLEKHNDPSRSLVCASLSLYTFSEPRLGLSAVWLSSLATLRRRGGGGGQEGSGGPATSAYEDYPGRLPAYPYPYLRRGGARGKCFSRIRIFCEPAVVIPVIGRAARSTAAPVLIELLYSPLCCLSSLVCLGLARPRLVGPTPWPLATC